MNRITRTLLSALLVLTSLVSQANDREYLWKKGKMPDPQPHQIAAMKDVASAEGFKPEKNSQPFLEWYDAPAAEVSKHACMILIPGGGYNNCVNMDMVKDWSEKLTAEGIQCVKLVYRTPRPEGLPIYQSAWEDGQRAVRLVRSEAEKRGYDPEKIGVIGMSAGSHLSLLLASSSQTAAYEPTDKIDELPCHINWAVTMALAYATTDGIGHKASREGYGTDVKLDGCFKFDSKTCPVSFHHGGADPWAPTGSTLAYREMRKLKIPAELHLYPDKGHGSYGLERAIEFLHQTGLIGTLEPEVELLDRFTSDADRAEYIKEDIWPEGKMPDRQENQCEPYLEWHIPANLKTTAIQIIYSGGSYNANSPESFEVAPARRYLNEKGMAVVTIKYRVPRPAPESGLAKHTTAWQDLQRAIRIVRSEAASHGLDPDRIGIMGSSAGGHLTLMGVTSSKHRSYLPIDDIDKLPCNVQWGIGIYPAYALTDGIDQYNTTGGNDDSAVLVPEFSFDLDTAPMLLIHGDADVWAAMNSVKVWEKLRAIGLQSELHTLALRPHCFQRNASPGTGSYTWLDRIKEFLQHEKILKE